MTVPEGLAIAPAHFLTAPEEEYREYIEGDQHKHHVVKIDSVNGELKMKLFGSFTRVEHRFSFSTEELKNETFCYLTTGMHLMKFLFPSYMNTCNHAIKKTFLFSRKINRCPHWDGALVVNFLCQAVANNEEKLKEYLQTAPETEDCLYKYPWSQLTLGQEYKIESRFGDAVTTIPFSFIKLCKHNGMLRLGEIYSDPQNINCKELRAVRLNILEGKGDDKWEAVHPFTMTIDPCTHETACNMTNRNLESGLPQRPQASNSASGVQQSIYISTSGGDQQNIHGKKNKAQTGGNFHGETNFNMY